MAKKREEKRNRRHKTKSEFSDLLFKLPCRWFQNIDPKAVKAGRNPLLASPVSLFPDREQACRGKGMTASKGQKPGPNSQPNLLSLKAHWTETYFAAHRN